MALATQASSTISAPAKESELNWFITTDAVEFRRRPVRAGEVRVLDRSALITAQQERRAAFTAAQIEGQKTYNK